MKINPPKLKIPKYKIIITLVIIITTIMFNTFSNNLLPKLESYTMFVIEKSVNEKLVEVFDSELFSSEEYLDILVVTQNDYGEIISVDFDLDKSNQLLKIANQMLIEKLNNIDQGNEDVLFSKPTYFSQNDNGLLINIPITFAQDNLLVKYIGPKIPLKIELINSYYSNLETSIKEYGINNILIEIYAKITVTNKLVFTIHEENYIKEYDQLIASKIITGQIPEYYGGIINQTTPLVLSE